MSRLRVLLSAYACEPGRGSEPGVGWKVAREMARRHDVWVLTRSNNEQAIRSALAQNQIPSLHVEYYDLPHWARWWKRGQRGVQAYYYLWQIGAYLSARRLHREHRFDLVQHVTLVKYWTPSLMSLLPIPFIWGPVGGGDSTPRRFLRDLGRGGRIYETVRTVGRAIGERDPLVRLTARRATLALATTEATAVRLHALGVRNVRLMSQVGASEEDFAVADDAPQGSTGPVRFISVGRLLAWKGFHLGLRAFALSAIPTAEYWIVGDGPERTRLEALAADLGVANQVKFCGRVSHHDVFALLIGSTALVHPSLHESGGDVCLEAMLCARPVICLDIGGPALLVTNETGYKVRPSDPQRTVEELARAMSALAFDVKARVQMGRAARIRVANCFRWDRKAAELESFYREATLRSEGARASGPRE